MALFTQSERNLLDFFAQNERRPITLRYMTRQSRLEREGLGKAERRYIYIFIHTKRATAKYAQRSKQGRATRKGMDEGKGGQTLSLQEREGENRKSKAQKMMVKF